VARARFSTALDLGLQLNCPRKRLHPQPGKLSPTVTKLMDVSIIIVNYNTKDFLASCLDSIYEQTKANSFEVIVSDNGSADGSIAMVENYFPKVILIKNRINIGFAAANNRAREIAIGKYVFYLNSDTVLLNDAVKHFYEYWESSSSNKVIGALGCNLVDESLHVIHSGGRFPTYLDICRRNLNITFLHYFKYILYLLGIRNLSFLDCVRKVSPRSSTTYLGRIDYVTGADLFMLNNSDAIFDERFFLYYEETDMQLKLKKKGLIRMIIGGPRIIHRTKPRAPISKVSSFSTVQSQISSLKYAKKNLTSRTALLEFIIKLDWKNRAVRSILREYSQYFKECL